jgi:hypothetical protein
MLTISGMDVIVHKGRVYNYQLPEEIIPGVPWPVGFREEFNEWAKVACGSKPIIPDDAIYMMDDTVIVSQVIYDSLVKLSK